MVLEQQIVRKRRCTRGHYCQRLAHSLLWLRLRNQQTFAFSATTFSGSQCPHLPDSSLRSWARHGPNSKHTNVTGHIFQESQSTQTSTRRSDCLLPKCKRDNSTGHIMLECMHTTRHEEAMHCQMMRMPIQVFMQCKQGSHNSWGQKSVSRTGTCSAIRDLAYLMLTNAVG